MVAVGLKHEFGSSLPLGPLLRILVLPNALVGAVAAKIAQEIQQFRDHLTDGLIQAKYPLLQNDSLAMAVYSSLRHVPDIDSNILAITTPLPEDTDAVLLVGFEEVTLDVQGKDVVITTWVQATLRRTSDGKTIYKNSFQYEDKDTLRNWTQNENALWKNYVNFARHYFGREISAEIFEKPAIRLRLQPVAPSPVSDRKDDNWQRTTTSPNPTLAWEFPPRGNPRRMLARMIDMGALHFDLEIYDERRLVYSAGHIAEARHDVAVALEGCKSFRWSVRPSFHFTGGTRFGGWMRSPTGIRHGNGHLGTKASETPAYTRGFALLRTICGRS